MGYSPLSICNLGLGKIGQARLTSIDNPKHKWEALAKDGYPHWRDSELAKRRWRFATLKITYGLQDENGPTDKPYRFAIPDNALRLVREKRSRWSRQTKKLLLSPNSVEEIETIIRVAEDDFPPEFAEVLAARCAVEMVEPITQSNEKWQKAQSLYKDAVNEAARTNAFELEPHTLTTPDEQSDWLNARFDPYSVMDDSGG